MLNILHVSTAKEPGKLVPEQHKHVAGLETRATDFVALKYTCLKYTCGCSWQKGPALPAGTKTVS